MRSIFWGVDLFVFLNVVFLSFAHLPQCLAGDSQPLDVCSVHQGSALVRYSVSLVGYGFYGDVLAESEKHRWMGPLRYDYSGTDAVRPLRNSDFDLSSQTAVEHPSRLL